MESTEIVKTKIIYFFKVLLEMMKTNVFLISLNIFCIFFAITSLKNVKKEKTIENSLQFFFQNGSFKNENNFDDIDVKIVSNFRNYEGKKIFIQTAEKAYPDYVYSKINANIDNQSQKNYVDLLIDLPWFEEAKENNNEEDIKKIIDESHIGLKSIKENVFKFLQLKKYAKYNKKINKKILCLFGPDGVGKTTIAQAIAKSLHRPFRKISLTETSEASIICGLSRDHDNAECGKIIKAINDTHVNNPVILIEGVDKIKKNSQSGDLLVSALLEAFDENRNKTFKDNYLDIPFDVSNVFFIITMNKIDDIPLELMNRVELVNIPAYNNYQKREIIKNKLIPEYSKKLDLEVIFDDDAIEYLVLLSQSKSEGGICEIRKRIELLIGTELKKKMHDENNINKIKEIFFDKEKVVSRLNEKCDFNNEELCNDMTDTVGAFNAMYYMVGHTGGSIKVRVSVTENSQKKGELKCIGFVNDDFSAKESIQRGFRYLLKNSYKYGIPIKKVFTSNITVQTVEGSAGSSMSLGVVVGMISAFKKIPIRGDIAFSGVIDSYGKVRPVGGLHEKIVSTYDLGFRNFIIPESNIEDVKMIPQEFIKGARFYFVKNVDDALQVALKK